jgi:poly(rC)-binding protein 3/4
MDGPVEGPVENTVIGVGVPTNLYNEEPANPAVHEEVKEEMESPHEEEPKDPSHDELANPEHADVKTEPVGDLDKEEHAIPLQEEAADADGEEPEAKQQDTVMPDEKKWPGWPGESVFRILVPTQKVGAVIGRKGDFIKKMCEESKARIKVLEGPQGATERAVSLPPASLTGCIRN